MQPRRAGSKIGQAQESELSWQQSYNQAQQNPASHARHQNQSRGDVGLQQMWPPPQATTHEGKTGEAAYEPKWRTKEMERQDSVSDYPESSYLSSMSYSPRSRASSTSVHQYIPSIPYHNASKSNDESKNITASSGLDSYKSTMRTRSDVLPRNKASQERMEEYKLTSHVMKPEQRQHSVISNASTAVSTKSHVSTSSNHSRLTSKFPVPRLLCSEGKPSSKGSKGQYSAKLLLSRPENAGVRADVAAHIAQQDARERKARWTKAKWLLLLSVTALFSYGLAGLLLALLTWFRTWSTADVLIVAENEVLIYITLASGMCIVTALVGLVGTMLNSRPILAVYNLLLWPSLAAILVIGYTSHRKQALNLDRKLNQAWSQFFDDAARLRLQNSLHCCGYYSPLHQATFSKRCYPRTALPGCKGKLFRFEKEMLHQIAMATFAIVPVHLFNIFIALLCSNHVNRTFGKGLMPRQYRLSIMDVRENAILALRTLPVKPEGVKIAAASARKTRKRTESGNDDGGKLKDGRDDSMSTGIRMIPHHHQHHHHHLHQEEEWGARQRHGNTRLSSQRRPPSSSPTESMRTLPRYDGNLKGLGLF